ncbi:MAG: sialidase [Chthoniobacter sp. 12-60-6]|nr:MAG: sialidase [Chthoniobacter sp. 12-60-6]
MIRLLTPALLAASFLHAAEPYELKLETITKGYDGKMCWVHPRAGAIPGSPPQVVLTMQKLLLTGSDVFYALNHLSTSDLSQTWTKPVENTATLGRREEADSVIVAACDFTPKWHAKSGKLLGIGHTVRYSGDKVIHNRPRETCFSVYDPQQSTWTPWTTLPMPEGTKFYNAGAGSVQRVDLENGDILLPIYFKAQADKYYRVTVLRCSFDGSTLRFIEQGNDLALESGRGVYEPSLIRCAGKFYLTLRNDTAGYVCTSDDGLHFSEPTRWNWTDGSDLGNYNTQQHWVTHKDHLYLVYTRRGANNDHVFRHRAPLFMAEVDKATLTVKRETERALVPERGARLGNFGVCEVSENETWVTVAEWMQKNGPDIVIKPDNQYGADNSVYAARILWK